MFSGLESTGAAGAVVAIAVATANRVLMLEHAFYSVISPEGAASILWRDTAKAQEAAKRAHDAAYAEARRTFEGKPPRGQATQPARTEPATTETQRTPVEDLQALLSRQRSFDRVVAKFDLSESALAIVEQDFATAKPDDVTGWLTQRANAFGWKPIGATTPNNQTPGGALTAPNQAPAANGPPVTAGGAPPTQQPVRTDRKLHELSPADQREYAARVGPIEFKNRLWKEMALVQVQVGRR